MKQLLSAILLSITINTSSYGAHTETFFDTPKVEQQNSVASKFKKVRKHPYFKPAMIALGIVSSIAVIGNYRPKQPLPESMSMTRHLKNFQDLSGREITKEEWKDAQLYDKQLQEAINQSQPTLFERVYAWLNPPRLIRDANNRVVRDFNHNGVRISKGTVLNSPNVIINGVRY